MILPPIKKFKGDEHEMIDFSKLNADDWKFKGRKFEDIDFSNLSSEQWKLFRRGNYKLNIKNMTKDTLTGTWIAVVGIIASVLAHFNIVASQDSIAAIVAGVIAIYGVIHQITVSKVATGSFK